MSGAVAGALRGWVAGAARFGAGRAGWGSKRSEPPAEGEPAESAGRVERGIEGGRPSVGRMPHCS